jgi:hypothetical protein
VLVSVLGIGPGDEVSVTTGPGLLVSSEMTTPFPDAVAGAGSSTSSPPTSAATLGTIATTVRRLRRAMLRGVMIRPPQ